MYKYLVFLIALLTSISYASQSIIQVDNTPENYEILRKLDLDYDCMGSSHEKLNFLLDESAREKLSSRPHSKKSLFRGAKVLHEDVNALFPKTRDENLGVYHTYEEMVKELNSAKKNFPNLVQLRSDIKSHEGRVIYIVELTDSTVNEEKKNYLVMGSHHSREWISVEVPLAFLSHMLENFGKNDKITKLLKTSRIILVPMLNPDGAVYSRTKYKMWRKNRKPNNGRYIGVDNNRNYPYKWGVVGASSWPGSDTYMGPEAGSEIENKLIISLQKKWDFTAAVSFHSYSELVLWPWGYTNKIQSKDHAVFKKYGTKMAGFLGYKPMQISGLYEAAGGFDDTLYADYGVLTYTIELGKWFVPEESEVAPICKNSVKALLYLIENARDPFQKSRQHPRYEILIALEKAVFEMSRRPGEEISYKSLLKLSEYRIEDLALSMEDLKMEKNTRSIIMDAVRRNNRYGGLYQD